MLYRCIRKTVQREIRNTYVYFYFMQAMYIKNDLSIDYTVKYTIKEKIVTQVVQ